MSDAAGWNRGTRRIAEDREDAKSAGRPSGRILDHYRGRDVESSRTAWVKSSEWAGRTNGEIVRGLRSTRGNHGTGQRKRGKERGERERKTCQAHTGQSSRKGWDPGGRHDTGETGGTTNEEERTRKKEKSRQQGGGFDRRGRPPLRAASKPSREDRAGVNLAAVARQQREGRGETQDREKGNKNEKGKEQRKTKNEKRAENKRVHNTAAS